MPVEKVTLENLNEFIQVEAKEAAPAQEAAPEVEAEEVTLDAERTVEEAAPEDDPLDLSGLLDAPEELKEDPKSEEETAPKPEEAVIDPVIKNGIDELLAQEDLPEEPIKPSELIETVEEAINKLEDEIQLLSEHGYHYDIKTSQPFEPMPLEDGRSFYDLRPDEANNVIQQYRAENDNVTAQKLERAYIDYNQNKQTVEKLKEEKARDLALNKQKKDNREWEQLRDSFNSTVKNEYGYEVTEEDIQVLHNYLQSEFEQNKWLYGRHTKFQHLKRAVKNTGLAKKISKTAQSKQGKAPAAPDAQIKSKTQPAARKVALTKERIKALDHTQISDADELALLRSAFIK